MAATNIPTIFNVDVKSVGQKRTGRIKNQKVRKGKINKLSVTTAVEKAADQIQARRTAQVIDAKAEKRELRDPTDSHDSLRAVTRSVLFRQERKSRSEQVLDHSKGHNPAEDIGEETVAGINLGQRPLAGAVRRLRGPRSATGYTS